jgi:hypothetical protein
MHLFKIGKVSLTFVIEKTQTKTQSIQILPIKNKANLNK